MFTLKALLLISCAVACYCATVGLDLDEHWENFKKTHGKRYTPLEEAHRRAVFKKNALKIVNHNLEADLGKHSYTLGINEFSDLEPEEFAKLYKGYKAPAKRDAPQQMFLARGVSVPQEVDWRSSNLVTPVKNQGQCGSCWAFSAVASLEGQHAKSTGQLVSLSEQNLVDCSGSYGNNGCNGGLMDYAFEYIRDNGGIDTEDSYPYEAQQGDCRYDPNNVGATLRSYVDVAQDEESLQEASATIGPISVAIDASHSDFQHYRGGVYDPPQCSSTQLDHGVTVVGYGTDSNSGLDYWLIKNSWGSSWGEEGYVKIVRNKGNRCGVASSASYPVV